MPRKRDGSPCVPSFLEPRRPCEQAIVACVMGAYVNGVSTRKVDRLVEQLGIHGIRVSTICLELDERLDAFRNRPLTTNLDPLQTAARAEYELQRSGAPGAPEITALLE